MRVGTPLGELGVTIVGAGYPAVLWHSVLVDSAQWCRIQNVLGSHRTLLMIDGPGHGVSDRPTRRFGLRDCADAALAVLDALGVHRADWVGNAWGGRVGTVFAADHPERVRSLTTFSAPPHRLPRAWRLAASALTVPYRALGAVGPITEAAMSALLGERARRHDFDAAMVASRAFLAGDRIGIARAARSVLLRAEDITDLLPRVVAPTLVVAGGSDPTFTADDAERAAALMPDARVEVVPSVFRLAPLERPQETAKLLLEHWDATSWS
ncbi:alpha/beta fold hydrolase [Luteimicrobium subarcticum]|uniref:Pimeloyl-ACP methyl ester carboxylesterase n=1 Tax=Luteimicrobium subarcticum TaxID=620910 RepID=A0A2M8WRR7_9MICO|nr:alpha/beta fold hydrolase [Luteimicrobium subarcticum]PJI93635.1 pimeloyl-ACP methyl ester carboxylesterase [Luteimicrobium subarcticum]